MFGRTLLVTSFLAFSTLSTTGCFLLQPGGNTPVFEGDDVRMETPKGSFRALGAQGEVMMLADEVATDVNRWVAEMADGLGEMLVELNENYPTREEGDWRIYGPNDAENGENASWMARVSGDEDEAHFEVLVGERGARESELRVLFTGDLVVDDTLRSGGFTIDFDVISKLAALQKDLRADEEFGGKIAVEFSRDTETQYKYVDMSFDEFWYVDPSEDEDFNYKDEQYAFHREDDGSGIFHFATWAPFEEEGWSGPERERVTVDMAWNGENAGRARAQIMEVEGQGDLRHGDVVLSECFDPGWSLSWANLNEPYAAEHPEYNEGSEEACLLEESALDAYAK